MYVYAYSVISTIHPVTLVGLEIMATALVIGFIDPVSFFRLALIPFIAECCWRTIVTCTQNIQWVFWATPVAGNAPTYLLRYVDLVLLDRWSFEAGGSMRLASVCDKHGSSEIAIASREGAVSSSKTTVWTRRNLACSLLFHPAIPTSYCYFHVPQLHGC